MKVEKSNYEIPLTTVILVITEGFICVSRVMQFGSDNSSGSFNDGNVVNGGDF